MSCRLPLLATLVFLCNPDAAAGVGGRTYFVGEQGDDRNPGNRAQPWRTLQRANQEDFQPGDRLLLEAGQIFEGPLILDSQDSGTENQKVIVDSYGRGRAVINGSIGRAISVQGSRFVTLRNLILVGNGRKSGNTESGLYIAHGQSIEVDSIEVSGFRSSGIHLTGTRGARITHVRAHGNGFAGISSGGDFSEDLYVGYCLAENNPGDPTILDNHSGSGIVLGKVRSGLIESCEARYNGWDMPRKGNGPVGIWSWHSDGIIIQHNISHHNRSTGIDGGGFDFDGGMTNSVMQYNYSHDNHGSGYLICQYQGAAPFRNNVVRYNISQDDGLTNHNAGIHIWVGGSGMESTDVYNNTIFNSKGSAVSFGAATGMVENRPLGRFYNNIFVSGEEQIAGGSQKGEFRGNLYWAMGDGGFLVDGFTSLEEWARATGQETVEGRLAGIYADPLLAKDGAGLLTDPMQSTSLSEYMLLPGSPAVDRALSLLRLFHIDPGNRDFYGQPVPQGAGFDLGAHEMVN